MNRLFYKFVRALMWPVQKLLWPTTIIGRENFDGVQGKAILVCNHYSTVDSMIICCNLFKKYNNALVKSEAFKNPVERWFLYKMGCIPVHRGEADMQAVKNVFKVLRRDEKILVFPEGTRNKQGTKKLQQIKPGVAMFSIRMDAPVIPMMYYRMHKIGRRNYAIIGKSHPLPFRKTLHDLHASRETRSNFADDSCHGRFVELEYFRNVNPSFPYFSTSLFSPCITAP